MKRIRLTTLLLVGCGSSTGANPPGTSDVSSDGGSIDASREGDASSSGDSGRTPGALPTPTANGCQPMQHDTSKVDGSNADTYAWSDSACKARSASLIRNDGTDAFGESGGYLRQLTYEVSGQKRACKGTGTNGWQGFGYVVNHFGGGASTTQHTTGKTTVVFAGKHHAIHEFTWRVYPGSPIDATARWITMTGRDHPLFSITFDSTPAGKDVANADTRAPYGDVAFEGGAPLPIDGIGWGDARKFTTKSSPVTTSAAWDYTQSNTVPYDLAWSNKADAEMGLVATHAFEVGPDGGDYGGNIAQRWGQTGNNLLAQLPDWTWPYQLNQYELPFGTTSHRVAWGANYGAVGKSSYTSFNRKLSGYPYTSYAVWVVLGAHAASAVMAQVSEMESVLQTKLTASIGSVDTSAIGGPGRADAITLAHEGFDAARAAWSAKATNNALSVSWTAPKALVNPVLVVREWSAGEPKLTWNGAELTAGTHYFASVDSANKEVWVTLNFAVTQGSLVVH